MTRDEIKQLRRDNHDLRKRLAIMERLAALALIETGRAGRECEAQEYRLVRQVARYLRQIPGLALVAERIQSAEYQEEQEFDASDRPLLRLKSE